MRIFDVVRFRQQRRSPVFCGLMAGLALLLLPALADAAKLRAIDGVRSFENIVRFENRDRRVLYLRPTTVVAGTRAPAIVLLHYAGGSAEDMANLTAIGRIVRETGIWVILPEAQGRVWGSNPGKDRKFPDDVAFLSRVIDDSVAAYPLDARRVYMAGFSAGAYMTLRYVCQRPDRIAAAAYVSATLTDTLREVCTPSMPTPLLGMHGTADRRVPYKSEFGVSSAPNTALYFARLNRCATTPVHSSLPDVTRDKTTVELDSYGSCASGDPVRFYTINGGGHTWPGNDYQAGGITNRISQDIDATRVIWDFLRVYSR